KSSSYTAVPLRWRSRAAAVPDLSSGCRACRPPTRLRWRRHMDSQTPILVVDDDEAIRGFLQLALEDAGYEVIVAVGGLDALEATRNCRPGLILLDMRMPRMNGWEFAEAYRRERSSHAPILIMTAGRDATLSEIGAAGLLGKPFDVDQLIANVRQHFDS